MTLGTAVEEGRKETADRVTRCPAGLAEAETFNKYTIAAVKTV